MPPRFIHHVQQSSNMCKFWIWPTLQLVLTMSISTTSLLALPQLKQLVCKDESCTFNFLTVAAYTANCWSYMLTYFNDHVFGSNCIGNEYSSIILIVRSLSASMEYFAQWSLYVFEFRFRQTCFNYLFNFCKNSFASSVLLNLLVLSLMYDCWIFGILYSAFTTLSFLSTSSGYS